MNSWMPAALVLLAAPALFQAPAQEVKVFRVLGVPAQEHGYGNFKSQVIASQNQFDAFVKLMKTQSGWNERDRFLKVLSEAKLDFANELLVLIRQTEGSSSIRVTFGVPELRGDRLVCPIHREVPRAGDLDMAYYCFAVAVKKGKAKQVEVWENLKGRPQEGGHPREILPLHAPTPTDVPSNQLKHDGPVSALACSADATVLAVASADTIVLWDTLKREPRRRFGIQGQRVAILAFSPDAKTLASGHADKTIHLWDLASGKELGQFGGQNGPIGSLAFSPDGKTLASGGADRYIHLWDVSSGKPRGQLDRQSSWWLGTLAFALDGKTLFAGGYDGTVRQWDLASGKELQRWGVSQFTSIAQSPDGRTLAAGADGNSIRLFEMVSGKVRHQFGSHGAGDLLVLYSGDGRIIAGSPSRDAKITLWETCSGTKLHQLDGSGPIAFVGACFLAQGRGNTVFIWDLKETVKENHPALGVSPAELDTLWVELAAGDAARAYRAIGTLAASPERTMPFLKEKLLPLPGNNGQQPNLAKLIADLDDDNFRVRANAFKELAKLGRNAESTLLNARKTSASPEVQRCIDKLLQDLTGPGPTPAQLRFSRALTVLEWIGTPESRRVLEALAEGGTSAWDADEAKVVLQRVKNHRP